MYEEVKDPKIMQITAKENLLNKYINIDSKEEYVDVEVIYEIKENIGTKEKIVF